MRKLPDPVAARVPDDSDTFARLTAATQVAGGLLLATGRLPRIASAALAVTVLPANLGAHMFWNEPDGVSRTRQRRDFIVNLSLLGGLIIASADTAGKPSLGWRGRRAARRLTEAAARTPGAETLTTKVGHGLHSGAVRGKELAEAAGERSAPLIASARNTARALWRRRASGWAPWPRTRSPMPEDLPGTDHSPVPLSTGRLGRTDVPLRRSP